MSDEDAIVAVGLLTSRDLEALGSAFTRSFPVDQTPCFNGLLIAIDEADRALWRAREANADQNEPALMEIHCDPAKPR